MNPFSDTTNILEKLHDIEGLDPISAWPLALGWWIVIFIGLAMIAALLVYTAYWIAYKRSWKSDTLQRLTHLEKNLSETNARATAATLSEYLRRVAIRRFSRKECAGLTGDAWLLWLTQNDPKQFDWKSKGALLIDIPYAPLNKSLSPEQIKDLIQAVRHWVR